MYRIALTLTLLFLLASTGAAQTDWTMFHLNSQHTGFNRFENTINRRNVKFLTRKWVGIAGDIVDFSSPAVVGGFVYLGSTDGNLYVFNADGCGGEVCNAVWTGNTDDAIY